MRFDWGSTAVPNPSSIFVQVVFSLRKDSGRFIFSNKTGHLQLVIIKINTLKVLDLAMASHIS